MSEIIDERLRRELPTMVNAELRNLTAEQQMHFLEEYRRRRKSSGWAWPLWFIGWHLAYIERRWGFNFFYFFIGIPITLGIWWIVEAFKVPKRLRDQRASAAIGALTDMRAVASSAATLAPGLATE